MIVTYKFSHNHFKIYIELCLITYNLESSYNYTSNEKLLIFLADTRLTDIGPSGVIWSVKG
jgi:hypothetical protein